MKTQSNYKKGHITKSGVIEWNTLLGLVSRLEKDQNYLFVSYITLAMYTGLRVSDVRRVKYSDILDNEKFVVIEQKTKNRNEP